MSDEFDPNWPHGHLAVWGGETYPAKIIHDNLPGRHLCVFIDDNIGDGTVIRARADGTTGTIVRLINAPAPVKHAEAWVNVWRHPDGGLYIGAHWDTLEEALDSKHSVNFIGAIRISTETADIIGPNGEKVKL